MEDTSGKLQPNQLTVDNLTVEWLKEKLTELESSLQDNREKQTALHGPEIIGNGVCKNNNGGVANGVNGIDRWVVMVDDPFGGVVELMDFPPRVVGSIPTRVDICMNFRYSRCSA